MSPPCCPNETMAYRTCLREKRSSGRKCDSLSRALEDCREVWRHNNNVGKLCFDGTRILPPKHCRSFNKEVQSCLKRTGVDELKCREPIEALKRCMSEAPGVVVAPPRK
mmetsp:Transcript_48863/g.90981  ORF Transcript_48863/g.90981 Transcript_48863/m.90981 type:complete len:109 (+) Transcript_48863:139-465(+)